MICGALRENSLSNHKKVIPFRQSGGPRSSQEKWQFSDYAGFEEWYQELSEEGQDTFDSVLKTNGNTPIPKHWNSSKMLQGEYKQEGLWEWCFFADGCQQRVIGVFGEKRKEAIFLLGCTHKQRIYQPAECLNTALKRAKEVRQGKAKLNGREVRSDI